MDTSTANKRKPRLALVLGAGGTRGWAHVGALKLLHEAALPIDLIIGASAGALIGALYAARRDAAALERLAMSFTPTDFLEWLLHGLQLSPRAGRMGHALWRAAGRLDFRELAVPFAAVALDLVSRRPVVLRAGNVGHAVGASMRPPLIGRPVQHDGSFLVDGGLHNPLPVSLARDLGAHIVVSVNVGELIVLPRPLRPLSARLGASYGARSSDPAAVDRQLSFLAALLSRGRPARAAADIEIRPDLRGISPMWPWHIPAAMRRGEAAARKALPAIRRLLAAPAPA